ncbi:hypothetical protein, partial [Streptococcus cuniculi]
NGEAMPIESLIELWEDMSFEEKEGWHTTVCERLKTDAESVIEYVIERLAEDGYEEMDVMLYDRLPTDAIDKLQAVLDELFDNSAADVYYPAERIEVE